MSTGILIVGGYGEVGRVVARRLASRHLVVVAGRRLEPARRLVAELGPGARAMQLDVDEPPSDVFDGVGTVVSCVERTGDALLRACLAAGVGYTEVATSLETMGTILALRDHPHAHRAPVIAGVGLIPGLSGVLAAHLAGEAGRIGSVESHLLLGLGDRHGPDAIRWVQHHLDRSFTVPTADGPMRAANFTDPRQVSFPGERRRRTTYRFDFADQHTLPETIDATAVSTHLCFDSPTVTRGMRLLKLAGLLHLPATISPTTFARLARWWPGASDRYALTVHVADRDDHRRLRAAATGRGETRATATVTATAVRLLHEGAVPPGIHHLDQVVALEQLADDLAEAGITLWPAQPTTALVGSTSTIAERQPSDWRPS